MNANEIYETLKNHKGQHVKACWVRPLKTRKDSSMLTILKTTCAYVRAGIEYSNLASVKEGIAEGTRGEVESLPWGEWTVRPFIISHKGNDYVRLYPAVFANLRAEVSYTIDGRPATAEECKPHCLASEFSDKDEAPKCFTLKAESLVDIG